MKKFKKKNKGFVSIEVMVGMAIASMLTMAGMVQLDNFNKTRLARNVGEHIKEVGRAADKYVDTFTAQIDNLAKGKYTESVSVAGQNVKSLVERPYTKETAKEKTGISTLFDGLTMSDDHKKFTITIDELVKTGMLRSNSKYNKSPIGSDYAIEFNLKYADKDQKMPYIEGMIVTTKPWKNGKGQVNYAMLAEATHEAGVDAGYTNWNKGQGANAKQIKGYKDGWVETSSDYSAIDQEGLLGYRFGLNAGDMYAYLRRDGTLPMTGTLRMDGNAIELSNDGPTIYANGDNAIIKAGDNYLNISPDDVTTDKWLCAKNEVSKKICMGGDTNDGNQAHNFEIKYEGDRPLLVHNDKFNTKTASTISGENKTDYVVFRVGGSATVHDNLYVGNRDNDVNDIVGRPKVDNKVIEKLSGKEGGTVVSNYNISYGQNVLKEGSKAGDISNDDAVRFSRDDSPTAVELNKDGTVIANNYYIKDIGGAKDGEATDSRLVGGLSMTQAIPAYSSRGAYVVYDEDLIQKPDCSWVDAPSEAAKAAAKKGIPRVILSTGNVHTSGDEVDESDSNITSSDSSEKLLRKHRLILKAEDLDPTGESTEDTYWRAIVKTRSFDGSKWVSAGQAVAHVYCQYY